MSKGRPALVLASGFTAALLMIGCTSGNFNAVGSNDFGALAFETNVVNSPGTTSTRVAPAIGKRRPPAGYVPIVVSTSGGGGAQPASATQPYHNGCSVRLRPNAYYDFTVEYEAVDCFKGPTIVNPTITFKARYYRGTNGSGDPNRDLLLHESTIYCVQPVNGDYKVRRTASGQVSFTEATVFPGDYILLTAIVEGEEDKDHGEIVKVDPN